MKKNIKTPRVHVPHRLYIIIRNDLQSLTPGKAMAQAAHAANEFIHYYGQLEAVHEDWCGNNPWMECERPFGTTIVLTADIDNLDNVMNIAEAKKIPHGEVYDPTYPFMTTREIAMLIPAETFTAPTDFKEDGRVVCYRNELTCGYVFVAEGSTEQMDTVGALELYP